METEAVYRAMLDARILLDAGSGEQKSQSTGERCIAFRVQDEYYAVDLVAVKEVIVLPEIVPVPGAGDEVLGVINLRGSVLTVINSRKMLGLQGCPEGAAARILVLDEDGSCVGVLVDAVEDIVSMDTGALEPVPTPSAEAGGGNIRGALAIGDEIAFVMRAAGLTGGAPPA